MNRRIVRNNLTRNKAVSLTTVLFVTAAALMMSLAAILASDLTGALGRLMAEARTPHFMQMHSGEPDIARLEAFAEENGNVADFQAVKFLGVDGLKITIGDNSLAGSIQDNGFCTQPQRFDFLLDLNNKLVQPQKGELYVPVCYLKDGTAKAGDSALVDGRPFVVKGFVRDSQMNSTLASSKRFLVSEEDFRLLELSGSPEYLIEFRLRDLSGLGAFETAYSHAGLPAGGPTLTWPLFQMISAVSDGIMIAVIVLIGILVILIALLCVRFTLLAKIEDDYQEIGLMRAIGMQLSDIRSIYLAIYGAMAGAGCILGFLLSLLVRKPMQESIRLNLGDSGNQTSALLPGIVCAFLVFLFILLYASLSLRCFRKISSVQAMRFGAVQNTKAGVGRIRLSENRWCSTNLFLGIRDVLARKHLYITLLAVTVLASFIMIVPQNLYHTISGDDFVTYLGVGDCDLRLDIQQADQIGQKTEEIGKYMDADREIEKYVLFTTKVLKVRLENGTVDQIKVELGDHSVFPLQYVEGRMPAAENEISLSAIQAEELEKSVGKTITLITGEGERRLVVCGIYSDITNGGKTAKAVFAADSDETAWTMACAALEDPEKTAGKAAEYGKRFGYAKVSGIDEYMAQTFGQTLQAVRKASRIAFLSAAAVTLLVTFLFMKLLAAKDQYSIAVMRAVGYTSFDISRQYAWRAAIVLAAGIVLGTILAGTLGESLSGMAVSSLGAAAFHFTVDPVSTYIISPFVMFFAALAAVVWGTFRAGEVKLYESIKE